MTESTFVRVETSTVDNIVAFVRPSTRAKRPRLEICPYGTVTLIAPRRFGVGHWRRFVFQHADWITRTLARIENHRSAAPHLHTLRPTTIVLPALGETWLTEYATDPRRKTTENKESSPHTLTIRSHRRDEHLGHLQAWVRARAKQTFPHRLAELSAQTGLRYRSVHIRSQKTRWGSCTRDGTISLNQNLLFLKPELADYLMIHELCHTVFMSHSSRYWALVKRFKPEYARHENQLRHAANQVPHWAVSGRPVEAVPSETVVRVSTTKPKPLGLEHSEQLILQF